jgi:ABC-type glycerol-3-phosphate transport system substrate-binding protein
MRWRARWEALLLVLLLSLPSGVVAKTALVHYAYTGHGDQYRQFIDLAKANFEKANTNIEIEIVEGADYTKALTMALGGVAPDVLDMSTNLAFSSVSRGYGRRTRSPYAVFALPSLPPKLSHPQRYDS